MSPEERAVWLAWEKRTGKCSGCGHSHRLHNELAYCRSNTSHDGSGPCTCGSPNAENRKLHLQEAPA
jgi:hypothetical protein